MDLNRAKKIENKIINGFLELGTKQYVKQLRSLVSGADEDHNSLGRGDIIKHQNVSAQMDKLKHTNAYTKMYEDDVKNHK